jgi:hypothetical protein
MIFTLYFQQRADALDGPLRIEEISDVNFGKQKTGTGSLTTSATQTIRIVDPSEREERGGFRLCVKVKENLHEDGFEVPGAHFSLKNIQRNAIASPIDLSSQGDNFDLNADSQVILAVDPGVNQSEEYQIAVRAFELNIPDLSSLKAGSYKAVFEFTLENVPAPVPPVVTVPDPPANTEPQLDSPDPNNEGDPAIDHVHLPNAFAEDAISNLEQRVEARKLRITSDLMILQKISRVINSDHYLDVSPISRFDSSKTLYANLNVIETEYYNEEKSVIQINHNIFKRALNNIFERICRLEFEDLSEACNMMFHAYVILGKHFVSYTDPSTRQEHSRLKDFVSRHSGVLPQTITLTDIYFWHNVPGKRDYRQIQYSVSLDKIETNQLDKLFSMKWQVGGKYKTKKGVWFEMLADEQRLLYKNQKINDLYKVPDRWVNPASKKAYLSEFDSKNALSPKEEDELNNQIGLCFVPIK